MCCHNAKGGQADGGLEDLVVVDGDVCARGLCSWMINCGNSVFAGGCM